VDPSGALVDLAAGRVADLVASQSDQVSDSVKRESVGKAVRQVLPNGLNALSKLRPEREVVAALREFLRDRGAPATEEAPYDFAITKKARSAATPSMTEVAR